MPGKQNHWIAAFLVLNISTTMAMVWAGAHDLDLDWQ
jgi:hypothetical protein